MQEELSMELKPLESCRLPRSAPPGYEQCVAAEMERRASYVASPLAMAALFGWDEEEE